MQCQQDCLSSLLEALICHRVMTAFTNSKIDNDARYAFKYAGHRGITGTAQFIVNGVHDPDAAGYNADQWKAFITSLMKNEPLNKEEL